MFRWMITREIKCREIVYGSLQARIVGDSGLELALASTGQSITSFTFVSDKGSALPRFQPTHGSIRLLTKYCRYLRNFSCYYVRFPSCASGSELFYKCKQLRYIDFNLVSSLPADFLDACFSAPHLTNLTMVKCNLSEQLYTLETSATIRSLTFSDTRLTVEQVLQLCEHCPNLVNLFIESHTGFLDVVEIAHFCPLLQECTIINPNYLNASTAVALCEEWKAIAALTLCPKSTGNNHLYSEEALLVLIKQCPTLQCLRVSNTILPRIVDRKCPLSVLTYPTVSQLRELVVDSVTAATVETILSNCFHLYSLHVIYRRSPSGQYGVAFIEACLDLLHHSSVKKLILE